MNNMWHKKNNVGYTLIELILAVGILVMIMTLVAGIMAHYFTAQRIQIAQAGLQEDVRFALELMTREIRTGYGSTFILPDGTGQALTLRNQKGDCVEYRLNTNTRQIERAEASVSSGDACDLTNASFAAITSHNTSVDILKFDPTKSEATADGFPANQGFVVITIEASARTGSKLGIALQTTATSRQVILFPTQ